MLAFTWILENNHNNVINNNVKITNLKQNKQFKLKWNHEYQINNKWFKISKLIKIKSEKYLLRQ